MPRNDEVTKKTADLISVLRELSAEAGKSEGSLRKLETSLNEITSIKVNNIKDAATLIANFNRQIKEMGADRATVKNLTKDFADLLKTVELVQATTARTNAIRNARNARKQINTSIIMGDVERESEVQQRFDKHKAIADESTKTLKYLEQTWKKNLDVANKVASLRDRALQTLSSRRLAAKEVDTTRQYIDTLYRNSKLPQIGAGGGYPLLPATTGGVRKPLITPFTTTPPGTPSIIVTQAPLPTIPPLPIVPPTPQVSTASAIIPSPVIPPITIPPIVIPPIEVPKLVIPPVEIPQPTVPLLPAGTPQIPRLSYDQLNALLNPKLPAGNIPPYPASRYPLFNQPQYPLLPPGTPVNPPTPPINYTAPLLPTGNIPLQLPKTVGDIIDGVFVERIEQNAEAVKFHRVSPLPDIQSPGMGETTADVKNRESLQEARKQNKIWQEEQIISPQALQGIGLTGVAAENLSRTMKDLGMNQARVTSSSTELSTGISTITFEAQRAGGSIGTFTAHIDKYGNVLQDTQKRFRGFGSAVMRDILEVMKWTIAITAIYTPIRKLGEMMEEMKKIQLDMVDVQIVLGNSTRELNTVLDASAKIASETSSSWEGVIEGYSLAAAASSSADTELQRMVTTETLLKDSMILAKLANIDQKAALDTLVGSLSQLGMSLDSGTQLLDSWVAVSKKANVSVKDMATSFTIVGSAAEEVGLTYNELNALIGGLAQSTNLSADELGNAIRGIISTMQTDRAQQEFAKYGIATKTFSNDLRDLMSILNEMKILSQEGILDEKAMGALTQAGGGGARRGAQLSALVQNLGRVMELVTISEQANGDAAQAMELEMATLDAATTRLNNSFSMLAVTLGGEGGILGILTKLTDGLTFLITKLKDLTSILKGTAPLLAGFLLAKGISKTPQGAGLLNRPITDFMASLFTSPTLPRTTAAGEQLKDIRLPGILRKIQRSNIGVMPGGVTTTLANEGGMFYYTGTSTAAPMGTMNPPERKANWREFGNSIGLVLNRQFLGKLSAASLAGPAMVALSNLGQGGSWGRAGVGAFGGIATAAITGSPVWATVGSIIATGFYDKFLTLQGDIAVSWTEYAKKYGKEPPDTDLEDNATILEKINAEFGDSMTPLQNFVTTLGVYANELFRMSGGGISPEAGAVAPILTGKQAVGGEMLGQAEMILAYSMMKEGDLGIFKNLFTDEQKEKIREMVRRWTTEMIEQGTITGEIPLTPFQEQVKNEMDAVAQYAATASATMMKEAIDAISSGAEGAIPAYVEVQNAAMTLSNTASALIAAQKGLSTDINEYLGTSIPQMEGVVAAPGYKPFTPEEAVTYLQGLSPDERQATVTAYEEISDILNNIYNLNADIEDQAGGATPAQVKLMESYKNEMLLLGQTFPIVLGGLQQSSFTNLFREQLKEFIELPLMTDEQIEQVRVEADRQWTEWFKAQEANPEQIEAYKNSLIAMKLKIGEEFTGIESIIPANFWESAMQTLGLGQPASLTDMSDVTTAQLQSMMAMYPQLVKQIEQIAKNAGMMWQPNEQDYIVTTKDGFETIHADLSLLGLLQQDLLDETKKQGLQGIYNLPAGATFMVPVSAYELDRATRAEMAESGSATASILQSIFDLLTNEFSEAGEEDTQTIDERQQAISEAMTARIEQLQYKQEQFLTGKTSTGIPIEPARPIPLETPREIPLEIPREIPIEPQRNIPLESYQEPALEQITSSLSQWSADIQRFFNNNIFGPPIPSEMFQGNMQQQSPVTTALTLDMTSNIQLMVDGRTLATIIKPYLYQDLIRYMTSANSSVNRSVIG